MNWFLFWLSLIPIDSCGKPYEGGWHADPPFCKLVSSAAIREFRDEGRVVLTIPDQGSNGQECLDPKPKPTPTQSRKPGLLYVDNRFSDQCREPRYVDIYLVNRRLVRFDRLTGKSSQQK